MSVKSSGAGSDVSAVHHQGVVKCGLLKKLKTSKKKFFVLRAETPETSARLEYYDTEKKFNSGQPPKRAITLKSCFNINRQPDAKHRHVIALYTKDDRFCIAFESDDELEVWLKILLSLQHGEEIGDGETPKPTFEHVWQVTLAKRGLGASFSSDNTVYRLCLTDKVLSLIRKDSLEPQIELSLSSIRSCGNLKTYFFLEIGRSSAIGAGELWMETEDTNIAQNVHQTVYHAMSSNNSSREELGPKYRIRSSSATESSKPTNINTTRRQPVPGAPKSLPFSQDITSSSSNTTEMSNPGSTTHTAGLPGNNATRERCDSMPSRARTTSEGNHIPFLNQPRYIYSHRPMSIGSPITPPSAAGSTDSAGSSTSIDDEHWHDTELLSSGGTGSGRCCSHSLTPDEPIVEENGEDMVDGAQYLCHSGSSCLTFIPRQTHTTRSDDGYVDMSPSNRTAPFMSPTASMSSVTSGTPSTDIRFGEFTMDKVHSYLTASEDEGNDRPARAYSFGSRPETGKYRTNHASDAARERAYSFGAKTKKIHNRILPPYGSYQHNTGYKSSSAPLLSNCRLQGSHSSMDHHEDLMEMDFSKPNIKGGNSSNSTSNSGYLDMKPGKAPSGYVEMKPGIPPENTERRRTPQNPIMTRKLSEVGRGQDHNKNPDYVDMTAGTSPGRSESFIRPKETSTSTGHGYMDMDLAKNKRDLRNRRVSSPLSQSPLSPSNPGDYMDMNCNTKHKISSSSQSGDVQYAFSPAKSSISPNMFEGSPSSIEYIDVEQPPPTATKNEGYVEMTPGKGVTSHNRQGSLDETDENSDYTNMSLGSSSPKKRERRNSSKKEKPRSQPIQIQTTSGPPPTAQLAKGPGSSSPLFYSWSGRKFSTGTPPKMYLPVTSSNYGLYSSLPRQRSRKNSRRDSKDSSTSSATTPSSSSTLFPMSLNSPSSPIKMDTPVGSAGTKLPPTITKYASNDDYAVMDFCKPKTNNNSRVEQVESDYVNYNPARSYQVTPAPETITTKTTKESSPVRSNLFGRMFKPISESSDGGRFRKSGSYRSLENLRSSDVESPSRESDQQKSSRPGSVSSDTSSLSRPGSTSSELGSNSSTVVGSRPSSVSNDPTRPHSNPCDMQLCYASLELVRPEEDGSRSPRTIKTQSSDGGLSAATSSDAAPESEPTFTYAKIDFVRSGESFKHNPPIPNNAKVKH